MDLSGYITLTFCQSERGENHSLTWVVDNANEACYAIEGRAGAVTISRKGVLDDKVPVATFYDGDQQELTVSFGHGTPTSPQCLLSTQSRSSKTLYNGSGQYQWCVVTDGRRSWYEIQNKLVHQQPFARLRVATSATSRVVVTLELSVDVWLHSSMCDGIIAAVVLMCITDDAWLERAGLTFPC